MRITLINQFYIPDSSPTASLCASLAEHRAACGDRVTVLCSRSGYMPIGNGGDDKSSGSPPPAAAPLAPNSGQSSNHPPILVRRLWSTRFGSGSKIGRLLDWTTFYLPAFWAAATMPRQDVLIALTTPPFVALAAWLHKLIHPSARLILWNMDVYPEALERTGLVKRGSVVSRMMRSASRAIFSRLDHLITLDPAMRDLLISQYAPPGRALPDTTISNWEPLELFPDSLADAPAQSPLVILYLGNAGFGHEFRTMIEAAELLRDDRVVFRFIGGGVMRPWIARQCVDRGLKNIVLEDSVAKSQTPHVMRSAHCALITLENDMLGVMSPSKLHANLAMGLPIIYVGPKRSNVDGAIGNFGCGISLRPGESQRLAGWIREMISEPGRLHAMRVAARSAFVREYCDRSALPCFDEVLASVTAAARSDRASSSLGRPGL